MLSTTPLGLQRLRAKKAEIGLVKGGLDDVRVAQLCADAMRNAALVAAKVAAQTGVHESADPIDPLHSVTTADGALVQLEHSAKELNELQPAYRAATLGAVGSGTFDCGRGHRPC